MNIKIDAILEHFQKFFKARLQTDLPFLEHIMAYAFHRSGKNIRTQLMIALCLDEGLDPLDGRLLRLATIVELVHSGTLFHDDVIDESPMRRGQPALHTIFDNKPSILLGDYCFTQAYLMAEELEECPIILPKLANTARSLVEGELWQLQWRQKALSLEDYHKMISLKTGCLFQFASESLIILEPTQHNTTFLSFGRAFGSLYQLLDDYQDYFQSAAILKKPPGQDFKERKVTLPILLAIEQGCLDFEDFFDPTLSFESLRAKLSPIQPQCLKYIHAHYEQCLKTLSIQSPYTRHIVAQIFFQATSPAVLQPSALCM